MGRLRSIAVIVLSLALPVWAQHGGGHGGGGGGHFGGGGGFHGSGGFHGGGFSGGHAGGFGGGHAGIGGGFGAHALSGSRTGPGFSRPFNRPFTQRAFSRAPFRNGFRNNRFRNDRFNDRFRGRRRDRDDDDFRFRSFGFNNCFGVGCWGYGYPWWNAGYYDPWWWWDSDSSYNNDDYNQNAAIAAEMNRQNLEEQQMLRREEADGDQDAYAQSSPAPNHATSQSEGDPIFPATLLIFRDGHQQEVQNYAITGQTLWNFSSHGNQRIPLADLDLTATADANDERGISFRIPSAGEAQ